MQQMRVTSDLENERAPAVTFARQGYVIVRGLIGPQRVAMLHEHLQKRAADGTMKLDDTLVPQTPRTYGDSLLDWLLNCLCCEIERYTGLALHPTYSYARIYKNGDILPPHRDRRACEISISLNVAQTPAEPWALNIGEREKFQAVLLGPGDGLIYRGVDHTHWRDAFKGQSMAQIFLHYVDRNGPYAEEKFDRRSAFTMPRSDEAGEARS